MKDRSEIWTYGEIKNGEPYQVKGAEFTDAIKKRFPKEGQRFKWIVKPLFRKRSDPLNKYYWGVIIDLFIIGEEEIGGEMWIYPDITFNHYEVTGKYFRGNYKKYLEAINKPILKEAA